MLTDEQVIELRRLRYEEGWLLRELADEFQVSERHAGKIARRDCYKWVPQYGDEA